jgi:hypothetical protein
MPRPYVVLSLLFLLIVAVLGPRPNVVVVGTSHPAAQTAQASQTTPTPNWLPADLLSHAAGLAARAIHPPGLLDQGLAAGGAAVERGLPLRAQVRLSYNTGR